MDTNNEFLRDKRKEEYQYQHFQFTTTIFKNELKEMEMEIIEDAIEKMKKTLIGKYPSKTEIITSACTKLIEEYGQKTEEWVSSIKGKLESTFIGIPSHVLLPEDKPQVKQYSKEYVEQIQEEIKVLEKKLRQAKFMKAKLKEASKASENCLETISRLHNETAGEDSKKFLQPTSNIMLDMEKINEGGSYISSKLKNSDSPQEEVPLFIQTNVRISKELS